MTLLVQTILLGLLIGGVYALFASGLTLVFGVMGIVNVAHPAFLVLAGLFTYELWSRLGIDPLLLTLVTTPVMFAVGWLVYKGLVARVRSSATSMSVVLTFGLAIALEGAMGMTWKNVFRSVTPVYFNQSFHVGALVLPKAQVFGCAASAVVLFLLYLLLTRTWMGRAIRSASENPEGAHLVGIDIGTVSAFTFAIGIATAGVGGSVMSILYPIFPASQYVWISRTLGIIVLGGMGSLPGAVLGALVLGVAETLTATYVSTQWSVVVFYVVILVVLLVKPEGLMGARMRKDVVA
ncbi:MAG TPA: branched-chain amino acid ABC transporter permease [Trueperaceae bacterium]|nr:branched-chain amino acid ABC transporter permease [Trueperaceae bacterium]